MKQYWIGLDVGGTKCAVLLATVDLGIHIQDKIRFETMAHLGFQQAYDRLVDAMEEIVSRNGLTYADAVALINDTEAPITWQMADLNLPEECRDLLDERKVIGEITLDPHDAVLLKGC